MPNASKKSLLVIARRTPYGNSLARSSLEVALSSATFDQNVGLLFLGEGVLQLIPGQESSELGIRNIAKLITSFPLYELNSIFVDELAVVNYGIDKKQLPDTAVVLDDEAIAQLMCRYDHVLGF